MGLYPQLHKRVARPNHLEWIIRKPPNAELKSPAIQSHQLCGTEAVCSGPVKWEAFPTPAPGGGKSPGLSPNTVGLRFVTGDCRCCDGRGGRERAFDMPHFPNGDGH